MRPEHYLPGDIERTSMAIITREMKERGIFVPPEQEAVVRRVIHTTADFDYGENLRFSSDAVAAGTAYLAKGGVIVTDTNMARAGVSKPILARLGGDVRCFMAEEETARQAKERGSTRAVVCVDRAAEEYPNGLLAVGNAPTALLRAVELMEKGYRPALIVAAPVGFVNVVESKELLWETCLCLGVPVIAAMGRKGGSNVAAAICNALLYQAADALDPSARGWQG